MTGESGRGAPSPHVALARAAIDAWVRERRALSQQEKQEYGDLLGEKAAAFVSLKKGGALRGCIGTFRPACGDLADEIAVNAVSAATRDPRFPPVTPDELEDLEISVDVLSEPEPVPDESFLDARDYGVIVQSGGRIGLLLPDLEGIDSVKEQVEIARRKAGISPHEPVQLYRFKVNRYR